MYSQTKLELMDIFRVWYCDYLTIAVFAEHRGITEKRAYRLINAGRKAHNLNANKLQRG